MTKAQKEAEVKTKAEGTQKEAEVKTKATKGVSVVLKVRYGLNLSGEKVVLAKETAEQLIKDGFAKKA